MGNMNKYKTLNFGEISFEDNHGYKSVRLEYNNHLINIFIDEDIYKNKMDMSLNIIDKIFEINIIAKKTILNNYFKKLNNCFKCRFDYIKEKMIRKVFDIYTYRNVNYGCIEKLLTYPNSLNITINDNNEFIIILGYILQNDCKFGRSGVMLHIFMDVQFNVFDFNYGEMMVN
jgi:hypothetical protein